MQVSVRELKAHLSRYLRLVQTGETLVITNHSRPIARLEPVAPEESAEGLAKLASSPGIAWSGGKPQGARVALTPGAKTASEMVLEDRR